MDNKFSIKNFIIKEADEDIPLKKKISEEIPGKDTQYTSQINKEEDSYGVPSDNDTEKNITPKKLSHELETHRSILQKELILEEEKNKKKNLKRKHIPVFEKKDNRKRIETNIRKNIIRSKNLGIINGKLNIGFAENKENKNVNDENNREKTPIKKFQDEDDEEIDRLKLSNERKNIENVNKNINKDFIKRMKDNEDFLKNNNIILGDGIDFNKEKKMKRNKSEVGLGLDKKNGLGHNRLKLYCFKGAFLNKNRK